MTMTMRMKACFHQTLLLMTVSPTGALCLTLIPVIVVAGRQGANEFDQQGLVVAL
jgi:hypothetical protein